MNENELSPESLSNIEIVHQEVLRVERLQSLKTLITPEWLIKKGFKQVEKSNTYHYTIDLKLMNTKAIIDASLMPHNKWVAHYTINGYGASKSLTTVGEIEDLINAVS